MARSGESIDRVGCPVRVKVHYFYADWEEIEELSFGNATLMAASIAMGQWMGYLASGCSVCDALHPMLKDVAAMTVEVDRG